MEIEVDTEVAMEILGARIADACASNGGLIYLQGELGAGKTTLVRGLLRALGHRGSVKSPTFTLVEPYELGRPVYHFDLFRVSELEELEAIGLRDYFAPGDLCLVEWPERGAGLLPKPDLQIDIGYALVGRLVHLQAFTEQGGAMLLHLRE